MLYTKTKDRGSVLLVTIILLILMLGMSVALLKSASANKMSNTTGQNYDRGLAVAEAGVDFTVNAMNNYKSGQFSTMTRTFSTGNTATVTVTPTFAGVPGTYSIQSAGVIGAVGGGLGTKHTITVVVQATYSGIFEYGLFSWQTLAMSSNERSDSWISGPPPAGSPAYDKSGYPTVYDNQAVNTYNAKTYALANCTDGSNTNIVFANSNNYVFGNAVPGPGDSVTLNGAYVSGSTTPASQPFSFPSISVPVYASSGNLTVGSKTPVTITGNVHYDSISTNSGSSFTIKGPAKVVVDSLSMSSNTSFTLDDSGGPITIYGTGQFAMASNTATLGPTSGVPGNLQVYITTDNYTGFTDPKKYPNGNPAVPVGFSSNNALVGAWYAPKAVTALPSNYQVFGSVVSQELGPCSNFQVHYDQNMAALNGGPPQYKVKVWYENPADQ